MSNRLTFSLASLIFLIALGLVFVPTSVMAHPHVDDPGTPAVDESIPDDHVLADHPTVAITLVSVNAPAFTEDSIDGTEVRLVNSAGDAFAILEDDPGPPPVIAENGKFGLKFTFSQDLLPHGGGGGQTQLVANQITITAIDEDGGTVNPAGWTIALPVRGTGAEADNVYTAEVTVPLADYTSIPITIFVRVNANAVQSAPRTSLQGDAVPSLVNLAPTRPYAQFTIVGDPPPTPDTTPPVMSITPPSGPEANGDLVFLIDVDDTLDDSGANALQVSDFTIEGIVDGTAVLAEVDPVPATRPAGVAEHYTLTVTPDPDGDGSVTVELDEEAVYGTDGNAVLPVSATYDVTAPSVDISELVVEGDEDITFVILFNEPIGDPTIPGSGFSIADLDVSNAERLRVADLESIPAEEVPDPWVVGYVLTVTPTDPTMPVTVSIDAGSVTDVSGNEIDEARYTSPPLVVVENTPPTFAAGDSVDPIVIWAGHAYKTGALPNATDTEEPQSQIHYRIEPDLPGTFDFNQDDRETRFIEISAATTAMSEGTYEYIAYNLLSDGTTVDSDPLEFTITVLDPVEPTAPTAVMAMEEGAVDPTLTGEALLAAVRARTVNTNKVVVNWTEPEDDTTPARTLIPIGMTEDPKFGSPVTAYKVYQHDANGTQIQSYDVTEKADVDSTSFKTPNPQNVGKYIFTVSAVNGEGEGPQSDKDQADKKNIALVLNPPNRPDNVDPSANTDGTVSLSWIPGPNAPPYMVEGAETGNEVMYGAVLAHLIEIVPPGADELTIEEDADSDTVDRIDTPLTAIGTYTFRVRAVNIDGVSFESLSDTKYEVTRPITATNRAPSFEESIDRVTATKDELFLNTLPPATDPDEGDALTYSLVDANNAALNTAIPGLSFDAASRSISGTATAVKAAAVYTYTATDKAGVTATAKVIIEVVSTTPVDTRTPPTATTTLANGEFVVFVRSLASAPEFGTASPKVAVWTGTKDGVAVEMPNLYELFTEGGGGSLQLNATGVDTRGVIMTEVMWAVDEGKVGQDSYAGQQWIEVHNRSGSSVNISDISFVVKDGRPALAQGTDLISNVVGGGDAWIRTKGQNGNSGAADGSGQKEFISMYRRNNDNQYNKDGWNGGHWAKSELVYHPNHKGTPGRAEPQGVRTFPASGVALNTIFNEIGNYSNSNHEWIELRIKSGDPNFKNWTVDMVTSESGRDVATDPTRTRLFKIPELNKGRYDDILLITKTDPARDDDHPLRGGYNVEKDFADQRNEGRDENIRYYVADEWDANLPDNGEFVLILRHGDKTNHEQVEDLAGYHPNLKVERANFFSNLWPLIGYPAPNLSNNKIASGEIDRRVYDDIPGTKTKDGNKIDKVAFRSDNNDWTGIGYKRNASFGDQNGGTPGYANNALQSNETQAGADPVIISEIMYATGERGNITQWIELRNTSQTVGVNLDGWQVSIVNHDQDSADTADTFPGDLVKNYNINGKIPPGQTFLLVAHSGTDNTNLPSERIVTLRNRRGERILSQYGFEITVAAKEKDDSRKVADKVGNLAEATGTRVRGNPQSYADPAWMLPSGTTEDGDRASIVRVYASGDPMPGQEKGAWKRFDMSAHINAPESTYYGNRNDLSSPGYTVDGVLPVSLSKFRPERMKDTGEIVIRWITESETNNAGFNILRGEAIDGEFTKINTSLIAGKGTTSERTAYEWKDTSAKPNVVYYYQIQDVSLDGQVQTLRVSRLKGNVTAAGKATTTWGELKALQ